MSGPLTNMSDGKFQLELVNRAIDRGAIILATVSSGLVPFDAQVGGISSHKKIFLRLEPSYVLKPLRLDHRKVREIGFYDLVNDLADRSNQKLSNQKDLFSSLSTFVPKYYGVAKVKRDQLDTSAVTGEEDAEYIILEDLTRNYSKPCIIDVKMGTQSFEPDASDEKKLKEAGKYPQQTDFGLRIVGMRVYNPSNANANDDGYVHYSKHFGRSLNTRCKLKEAFRAFIGTRGNGESISNVLEQLEEIKAWFLKNNYFGFYSSSIMIVYEGDEDKESSPPIVKMIDFARVRRQRGGDEGYLLGLNTLATLLHEIVCESQN
ncbi:unnamed protein product [Cylindrotheca closterium]|uniref:Kinase n=1 Tax=Cylindrotheca closterium TaxID=2856 RepID=A0AAD2CBZ8_9STRA|nr:unnamed protein product [Cylindrotheca closterium]